MLIVNYVLQNRCKITTFFGYMQVHFAEKCRFFDFFTLRQGLCRYNGRF